MCNQRDHFEMVSVLQERKFLRGITSYVSFISFYGRSSMRKIIIMAACAALLGGPAFAQTSQSQGGSSEMSKGAVKKGKTTTGMSGTTKQKTHKGGMKSQTPKY